MLTDFFSKKLLKNQSLHLKRERFPIQSKKKNIIKTNNRAFINFSSNDYLGMTTHPNVKKAFIKGIKKYGIGSGSSALVSGFYEPHYELEKGFAEFLKRDSAILFNSGYLANLGIITTLATRNTTIFSDQFCHASLLDGILLSRAKHNRYHHNDMNHCESLLERNKKGSLIITESVFSMEGNITSVKKLSELAKSYSSTLIVDDAHGIGVLGENGRGICEYYELNQKDLPCLITPLGKAFGSIGAIVSGEQLLIEGLLQFCKTYRYTTSLPPAISLAAIESLKIISKETWRREKLNNLIQFFIQEAKNRCLKIVSEDITPIKSILIGDNFTAIKAKNMLMEKGIFVSCIRPPTVPDGTARIRISLNCFHEQKDILYLLNLLANFYE